MHHRTCFILSNSVSASLELPTGLTLQHKTHQTYEDPSAHGGEPRVQRDGSLSRPTDLDTSEERSAELDRSHGFFRASDEGRERRSA